MEELGSTEEVAAAAAGRTAMLPCYYCCCCKPVMRTERRVEGGGDKGWAAGRCAAGDGRCKVAALPGGTNCSPPVQGPE